MSKRKQLEEAMFLAEQGEFEGLKVNDLSEVPAGYKGLVLHINDHGNVSLYKAFKCGTFHEIASCV